MSTISVILCTHNPRADYLAATIKGFEAICKGEYDDLPESAFYMVGSIEEVVQKAEKIAKDATS